MSEADRPDPAPGEIPQTTSSPAHDLTPIATGEVPEQLETRAGSSTRVLHLRELGGELHDGPRRAPTRIGPYRIRRQLGRGGMGSVYLAEPAASCPVPMGRMVAIKILHRTDAEERRRFAREAAYLQSLRHPGIVRVLDVGEHDGMPYLVMQLIDGKRLDDLVLKSPLPERVAAEMAVQALEALHVAHLAGILHRDIKPGNIMVDRTGTVRLLDFGLASQMHHESRLTRSGNVVGTPAYMSPEQASGDREAVSRRSDIYGMGACLYELLTAVQPYTADNSVAMLRRIIDEPLVPPSRLRANLSRDLETVVLVAMAKEAKDRYATSEAMAADLRLFLQGKRIKARRISRMRLAMRTAWRQRRAISALALSAFISLSAMGIGVAHFLRINRQVQIAHAPLPELNVWKRLKKIDGPITASSDVHITPYEQLGSGVQLVTLPSAAGAVRLSATVTLAETVSQVELFINDRDVALGYRLKLEGTEVGDSLILMREDKILRRQPLRRLHRDQSWRLSLEREDTDSGTRLTCRLNDEKPLRFRDLEPIDGTTAANTYIAYNPKLAEVRQVLFEHSTHPVGNVLDGGIALQSNGNYSNAIGEFQTFLLDFPDSPHAPEAKLRIAACLESQKDYVHAKDRFLELARVPNLNREYKLSALFSAWSCSLHTGDYDLAEQLFAQIRNDYDLETLVSSIPDEQLDGVLENYFERAIKLSSSDPDRAANLYATGTELAVFLHNAPKISQGRTGAGDVLVGRKRYQDAKNLYYETAIDQSLSLDSRLKATLKIAEVERLLEHMDASEVSYQSVINSPLQGDPPQLARLYLGDLYLQEGQLDRARAMWKTSSEAASLPGQIMAHLVGGQGPMPATTDPWYLNDVEYFTARLALLKGQVALYREDLGETVRIGPPYDWPTPLAEHLLTQPLPTIPVPDNRAATPVSGPTGQVQAPAPSSTTATPAIPVPAPAGATAVPSAVPAGAPAVPPALPPTATGAPPPAAVPASGSAK